ncbi:hypothetical protein EDD11_004853 [Mortierella claussenii]|nr:hypothetical protein EDD11_004853 [Mortierella claussenii]
MPQAVMTQNPSAMLSADQFTMLHHSSQQSSAATVTASLTSEFIHASLVAASSRSQMQPNQRTYTSHQDTSMPCYPSNNSTSSASVTSGRENSNIININCNNSSAAKGKRGVTCVAAPKTSSSTLATLEYSVHISPRRMTRDLATVFPNKDLSNLLVVPTFQKCQYDMVAWDAVIAKEKDDRLEDFIRWSTAIHQKLETLGFWSDMTDPASGFPSFSERGRDVYPDVEGCQLLLKYDFQNAGCCKVLLHPVWGSKIYPATFFTTAPADVLLKVVQQVELEHQMLLLAPVLIICTSLCANAYASANARALHASSANDLEMIASWEPSGTSRFDPHAGSLLAPFMIPRVSGTVNNTRVQNFILDYFAKLNTTSLTGGSLDAQEDSRTMRKDIPETTDRLFRRAPGVPGTGWHVELDRFTDTTPFGPKTFTNLIFTKNPKAENRLVFAAHFDSKYFPPALKPGEKLNGGEDTLPFVAATDSAAPCAILLDLAASLDRVLDQPGRGDKDTTLQLVFFDGEEAFEEWTANDSLYGSRHLAETWAQRAVPRSRTATGRNGGSFSNNLDGIELFVLLDLLGAENPNVPSYFGATYWAHRHTMSIEHRLWEAKLHGSQVLSKSREKWPDAADEPGDDMDAMDTDEPLQGFLSENTPWGGIDDDHRPFLQRGVPVFHVIPTPFPSVWHKLEDNADAIRPEVVEGWANIFRTFTVEYLQLLKPNERRRDEL